jgi:hypothetical protein
MPLLLFEYVDCLACHAVPQPELGLYQQQQLGDVEVHQRTGRAVMLRATIKTTLDLLANMLQLKEKHHRLTFSRVYV